MTFLTNYPDTAHVMAIVALSIAPISYLVLKKYYRGLYFLQFSFYLNIIFATTVINLSTYLGYSCTNFNANILSFCNAGDLVCTLQFPLSFAVIYVGLLVISLIFTALQRCCGNDIKFEPVYTFFKGFLIWFYVPIVVNSASVLITQLNKNSNGLTYDSDELIRSIALLAISGAFPVLQLIGYKCIQKQNDNIWLKWIQFFHWVRLFGIGFLIGTATSYQLNNYYSQFAMIPEILYILIAVWKDQYRHPVLERLIFIAGQLAYLGLFYNYHYNTSAVRDNQLDFILLGGIMAVDALYLLIRLIRLIVYGPQKNGAEINPQDTLRDNHMNNNSNTPLPSKKVNKYQHESGSDLQNSRDNLSLNKSPSNSLVKKKR